MAMSRPDFQRMADALNRAHARVDVSDKLSSDMIEYVHRIYCDSIARECKRINPKFNYDRFIAACELE